MHRLQKIKEKRIKITKVKPMALELHLKTEYSYETLYNIKKKVSSGKFFLNYRSR